MTVQVPWHLPQSNPSDSNRGFTLIEILVAIVITGILATLVALSWNGFMTRRELDTSRDKVHQVMRQAQAQSLKTHQPWEASFKEPNGFIQFAIHGKDETPTVWENFIPGIHIDTGETTLSTSSTRYRVVFDAGRVSGQLGRLTLMSDRHLRAKRCVIVSTLMGALRKGQDHPNPDATGRFCY